MTNLKTTYEKQGYLYKFRAIKELEAKYIFNKFSKERSKYNSKIIKDEFIYKPHLILKSLFDLTINEKIIYTVRKYLEIKLFSGIA